jgi:hypothetical protein
MRVFRLDRGRIGYCTDINVATASRVAEEDPERSGVIRRRHSEPPRGLARATAARHDVPPQLKRAGRARADEDGPRRRRVVAMYTRRQRPAVCADELRTDEASGVAAVPDLLTRIIRPNREPAAPWTSMMAPARSPARHRGVPAAPAPDGNTTAALARAVPIVPNNVARNAIVTSAVLDVPGATLRSPTPTLHRDAPQGNPESGSAAASRQGRDPATAADGHRNAAWPIPRSGARSCARS